MRPQDRFGSNKGHAKVIGVNPLRRRAPARNEEAAEECERVQQQGHSEHDRLEKPRPRRVGKAPRYETNYYGDDDDVDVELDAPPSPLPRGRLFGVKKQSEEEDQKWLEARSAIVQSHYSSVAEQRIQAIAGVLARVSGWQSAAKQQPCSACLPTVLKIRVIFLTCTAEVTFEWHVCDRCAFCVALLLFFACRVPVTPESV